MKHISSQFVYLVKKIYKEPVWILIVVLGSIIYALFSSHIIKSDLYGNLMTGESTYGDLPFHLATISQMAHIGIFSPENPLFSGTPLVYPFFINILSALITIWGFSLRFSIIFPGIVFSILMILCLYFFYKRLTKNKSVAFLSTLLFFLNGGLGFYYFFNDVILGGKLKYFFSNPSIFPDYSHLFEQNIQWCNFLSRILIPERSVLLGIPMGLIILFILFLRKKKSEKLIDWWFVFAGVLTGFLPLSHTHTFMVFSVLIPYLAFFEIHEIGFKKWLKKWLTFGVIVFLIVLPQMNLIFSHLSSSTTFFKFHIGWMSNPGILGLVTFWWKNTGVMIPLLVVSLFFIKPYKLLAKLVFFSFFILTIVNLFIFQPYNWDNIKFLFWFAIFSYPAISIFLIKLWKSKFIVSKILTTFFIILLVASSLLSLYRELNVSYQLFSKEEVGLGLWVKENVPADSLFLTGFTHRSFASNLGGRKILMGYQGSLWVHGIKYEDREKEIKEIYSGSSNAKKLINKYGIDYIIIGPEEKNDLNANQKFFSNNFCLAKTTANYLIFSVKCEYN